MENTVKEDFSNLSSSISSSLPNVSISTLILTCLLFCILTTILVLALIFFPKIEKLVKDQLNEKTDEIKQEITNTCGGES